MRFDVVRRCGHLRIVVGSAAALLVLTGCPDGRSIPGPEDAPCDPADPTCLSSAPPMPGLNVSEVRALQVGAAAATTDEQAGVAYVSVSPGTFDQAQSVRIINLASGLASSGTIPLIDGGFDPVAVSARAGDRLTLAVTENNGTITTVTFIVPVRRAPVVVRTKPPKGRTDVALSVRPLIVLSEPIDPQSLSGSTVTLLGDGTPVSGSAMVVDSMPFAVEFVPDAPLAPLGDYELIVTTALRDMQGDGLADELRVDFATGAPSASLLQVSNLTFGGAFDVDGYTYVVSTNDSTLEVGHLDVNSSVGVDVPSSGQLTVELQDVAPNCVVTGSTTRTVDLPVDEVLFTLQCAPPTELAGRRLLYAQWRFPEKIGASLVVGLAGSAKGTTLTFGNWNDINPVPSPDGSRIAFSREAPASGFWQGPFELYVMSATGGAITPLTQASTGPGTLAWDWSPDGTRIVATSGGTSALVIVSADGSGAQTILEDANARGAAWSPDGTRIAFQRFIPPTASGTNGTSSGGVEVWTIEANGSGARRLTALQQSFFGAHVSWSLDGSKVYYSDGAGGPPALWSVDADGSNPIMVIPPVQSGLDFGAWSPDRRYLTLIASGFGLPPGGWRSDVYLLDVQDRSLVHATAFGVNLDARFLP